MRYFVVCSSDVPNIAPYVVAEVVRDVPVDEDRRISLAAALAGERALIATRAELLTDPRGRAALDAWDARDDTEFERETLALAADGDTGLAVSYLRVVSNDESEPPRRSISLPTDARRREAVLRSQALRAAARRLVARAREHQGIQVEHKRPTVVP